MTQNRYVVRNAKPEDIVSIIGMCRAVYPGSPPWTEGQLLSHQTVFPEGQFVVANELTGVIVGFAASLILSWDDYDWSTPWRDFTAGGSFTNHDPQNGRTLYGAEIMVHPDYQGTGAGSLLYKTRESLAQRLGILRIRAGARLRGYHKHAQNMSAEDYTHAVIEGKLTDPTLSFQLKRGFYVLRVISDYLKHDPESLGFAALIEWINTEVARETDYRHLKASIFHADERLELRYR
jgi:GNAT superfamily N-acetyltransferase